jgi:hypothetical protein
MAGGPTLDPVRVTPIHVSVPASKHAMNELEARVLDLIGENSDAPDVYTDAGIVEIRDHLNDALEEVALLTAAQKHTWRIPLKANAIFYTIPTGPNRFAWVTSAWLYGGERRLTQTDFQGLDYLDPMWMWATGNPTHYVPIGLDQLAIYPAASGSADTLELTGIAIPARYTSDADPIKLRDSWAWAAVNLAVSSWWATRGDAKTATQFFTEYVQAIQVPQLYPDQAERRWQFKERGAR